MLKKVLGTMIFFAVIMIFCGGGISNAISAVAGGGVAESFIYPIYGGVIMLAGLVVGCTCVIFDELKEIKEFLEKKE